MAVTQDNRILNLSTPLGKDFLLINSLSATEGLSTLFEVEARLLHEETAEGTKPTEVDIQKILGKPVNIEILQPDGTNRHFNGICNRFTQGTRDTRWSHYEIAIVPAVWTLTQVVRSRIFQHKTIKEILKAIFEGYDVKQELEADYKPRNYCVQYRESDFDFASRLMEEEGIYYFFAHKGDSHQMILADTPKSHPDCPGMTEIEFMEVVEGEGFQASIREWIIDYKLQTGKIAFRDFHFQLPTNSFQVQQPSLFNVGGNQDLEVYDFPAAVTRKYDNIDRGNSERQDLNNAFPDMTRTAENAMAALDVKHKTVVGSGDVSAMTAGHRFKLKNHPSDTANGMYVITSITHNCDQSPDYTSDQDIDEPYFNSFTCIPYGSRAPQFRPPHQTPKPFMNGSQTAMVVGPEGEEIFTDKYGRVKVQFHWDREGKPEEGGTSCWVRVAKDIAGKKWGSMYIPRVGQEVIVDFMEGDPDQPIITGSVYNEASMPHYELPKYKTLTYVKTRTSPDDGKGFNELRFEDKKGKEQVFVHSQKRYDLRVRGSMYETCGGNRHEVIGVRSDNEPGGNLAITVGGNYDLHVKADQFIGIDGALYETVKSSVGEEYKGKLSTKVTSAGELNAQTITLESLTGITLKVGASFIVVDLTGITIQGPIVKINSGGAATGTSPFQMADPLDAERADTGEPGYLDRPRTGGGGGGRRWRTVDGYHAPTVTRDDNGVYHMGNVAVNPGTTNPNFQRDTLNDLAMISTTPEGQNTLNSIDSSGRTVTIDERPPNPTDPHNAETTAANQTNATNGTGSDSSIAYDPTIWPVPNSANPNSRTDAPSDVILHHELSHAEQIANGQDDLNPRTDCFTDDGEFTTIQADNRYRDERGIGQRTDHKDF